MRFASKVALITAAANGIGRATAEIMAREGAVVIAVDNHQGRLDEAVPSLRQGGGRVEGKLVDAMDAVQVEGLVAELVRDHGRIDILVNAVGGSTVIERPTASTEQLGFADWQKLIAFNLDATFLCTHAVIPVMRRQRSGKIVNLSSIAGRGLSVNSSSAYAAAKGGIIAFTRKLATELGPDNINVNAIAPSITLTERIRPHEALGQETPASLYRVSSRKLPARLAPPSYPHAMEVRRVRRNGTIKWEGKLLYVGEVLGGELLGVQANQADGKVRVHFYDRRLGTIVRRGGKIFLQCDAPPPRGRRIASKSVKSRKV